MAIKHSTTKAAGEKLFAVADWNASHTIDNSTITAEQTTFTDQELKTSSSPSFDGLSLGLGGLSTTGPGTFKFITVSDMAEEPVIGTYHSKYWDEIGSTYPTISSNVDYTIMEGGLFVTSVHDVSGAVLYFLDLDTLVIAIIQQDPSGDLNYFSSSGIHNFGSGNIITTGKGTFGKLKLSALPPIYANNAAAKAGGLVAGDIYRSGGDPDILYIVH